MTVIDYEDWSFEQQIAAFTALKAHDLRHTGHPIQFPNSTKLVVERIMQGVLRAAYIEGFLLVYDVGPTWCTEQDILYELLLIRVTADGDFDAYIAGLRELAKRNACFGIMTGNGVLRPGLRRQYLRRGFQQFNETYFMEV